MNNRKHATFLAATAAASLLSLAAARHAAAVPITGSYVDDARCDPISNQFLSHELGQVGFFPINEALQIGASPATFTVCVPDDGIANDWIVQISNISGIAWTNLFFVADKGLTVGNADGSMFDTIGAPAGPTDAFRIDGTVTLGLNNNLINESGIADEILSPGEQWRFNVSNFGPFNAASPPVPPTFLTPGFFAGSSTATAFTTASILATPVPEPTTVGALGLIAAMLLMGRRSRRA